MKNSCRCALVTLVGAVVLASAIITVGVSTGRMINEGVLTLPPLPLEKDTQPGRTGRSPFAGPHMLNRS